MTASQDALNQQQLRDKEAAALLEKITARIMPAIAIKECSVLIGDLVRDEPEPVVTRVLSILRERHYQLDGPRSVDDDCLHLQISWDQGGQS